MKKEDKILPKGFVTKQFKLEETKHPSDYSAKVYSYKGIFSRVNLPANLVRDLNIQHGDRLMFEIKKERINNKERAIFCSWVDK